MDPAPAQNSVPPKPGLPKTIGFLSLAFGGAFFLCGLVCLHPIGPMLVQLQPVTYPPEIMQITYEQVRGELITKLEQREKTATTDAEKTRLRRQRLELEAKHPQMKDQVNTKVLDGDLKWVTWWLWADVVTGPVLNLLMLASGIGLMQLKEWARRMALWVAALKLVRLVVLTVFFLVAVIPHLSHAMGLVFDTDLGKVIFASAMEDQRAIQGGAAPLPSGSSKDLVPLFKTVFIGGAVFFGAAAAIFPAVALVVLTRPGARVACEPVEEDDSVESTPDSW